MTRIDVIVVGAGVMGASTAWRLAKAGRQPVILEQFEVGHPHGSSHGSVRVFRFSYGDPMYVRMAMEALPLWRELERDTDREILTALGQLDWGEPFVETNAAALRECGAEAELLDSAEAMERYPVSIPDGERVLFHREGGIVRADDAVRASVDAALALGAELHERTRVIELRPGPDQVEVVTEGETYRAAVAVVTAGPWVKPLAVTAGIELPVMPSRETVTFFAHPEEMALPILVAWGEPTLYGLPDPGKGVKIGAHHAGPDAGPEEDGGADPAIVEMQAAWAAAHYPKADPAPLRAETCMYTNTSDERFILERYGRVVVGSACSGHGFKFAPLIGERLAHLAQD